MFHPNKRKATGFTLVETVITLLIFSMVAGLAFSTLSFFNQISGFDNDETNCDFLFERVHLFLQRQIEKTDHIYVDPDHESGRVYLLDTENPEYYNFYQLKASTLYRNKYSLTDTGKMLNRDKVSPYPFEEGIKSFSLKAEKNGSEFTGRIILTLTFLKQQKKTYETIFTPPDGKVIFEEIETI